VSLPRDACWYIWKSWKYVQHDITCGRTNISKLNRLIFATFCLKRAKTFAFVLEKRHTRIPLITLHEFGNSAVETGSMNQKIFLSIWPWDSKRIGNNASVLFSAWTYKDTNLNCAVIIAFSCWGYWEGYLRWDNMYSGRIRFQSGAWICYRNGGA
jgi:hypothetical protein